MIAFSPVSGSLQNTIFLCPNASSWLNIDSVEFWSGIFLSIRLAAKVDVFFGATK